ncbi:4Fe-4S dicluster domain-containing protein [Senegalimassilia faecalis]|uniref:4Fe-4S dicluster domain-containing protein n=1 Tax=Senegalimassilia faecalis TaxID=2509433 RepID=A0A4Q2JZV1_9ACTN|nr:4Fe-4S dicluster domain-containing protein [Senegalimassilia faecalis]RXZ54655.1 4Fe-4S dicluster domain-containing protein [Senegalimassilia faecalis]
MTHYAILTDLNKCVGCLACSISCKVVNNVPIGSYWNKVLRIGPNPRQEGGQWPDVYTYFLTVQCQHCKNPACVQVCPTEASHVLADGTVQIDKSKCIGCQFCAMACPYGVRYLNEEERVVEKCTLCEQKVAQGELPQCVSQCGGRARFFGDLEKGIESFEAPGAPLEGDKSYDAQVKSRIRLGDATGEGCDYPVKPYKDSEVYHLPNVGNDPGFVYILRNEQWQGQE